MSANNFERIARLNKSRALISAIDRERVEARVDILADAHVIAAWLRLFHAADWAAYAALAGCREPSRETREMVISEYDRRASLQRKRAS